MDNAKYPLELFQRVITVSIETMKIVNSLPKLNIDINDKNTKKITIPYHRVGNANIYFSDEINNLEQLKPVAEFKIHTDINFGQTEQLNNYESFKELNKRGIFSGEILTGYFDVIGTLQEYFSQYDLNTYNSDDNVEGSLVWSIKRATSGSTIYEIAAHFIIYGQIIKTTMDFFTMYPKASDGFERAKHDLKKIFKADKENDQLITLDSDVQKEIKNKY